MTTEEIQYMKSSPHTTGLEDAFSTSFCLDLSSSESRDLDERKTSNTTTTSTTVSSTPNSTIFPSVSPATIATLPSLSPATYNWLHSTLLTSGSTGSDTVSCSPLLPNALNDSTPNNFYDLPIDPSEHSASTSSSVVGIIDWKAVNETQSNWKKNSELKWKVIPQHGHQESVMPTTENNVKKETSFAGELAQRIQSGVSSGVSSIAGLFLNGKATSDKDDKKEALQDSLHKRKAIISPEFVQYAHQTIGKNPTVIEIKGRRPFKKTQLNDIQRDESIRCKCSGKCRNARCVCVKAGFSCSGQCKCTGCRNPFVHLEEFGLNAFHFKEDLCFMQNLSKIKDMSERLLDYVNTDCCGKSIQVKDALMNNGKYTCPSCQIKYTYSFCWNKLCQDSRKPRKHCSICKRCGDHRNQHCYKCGHCYFAGVANSFSCNCTAETVVSTVIESQAAGKLQSVAQNKDQPKNNNMSKQKEVLSEVEEEQQTENCPVQ